MSASCVLKRITIYPIKSLDGMDVTARPLNTKGGLAGDRAFALFDARGNLFNGKRGPALHRIRAVFSDDESHVELSAPGLAGAKFPLQVGSEINEFFSEALGESLELRASPPGGLPDDLECPGPTLVSLATLREVGAWFESDDVEEWHRRFRTSLVIDAPEPFYEDRLHGDKGGTPFLIGAVRLLGIRACARCAVPARSSLTGETHAGFQKRLTENRRAGLPNFADRSAFDHFYRLALNTRVPNASADMVLRVGDEVRPELDFSFDW